MNTFKEAMAKLGTRDSKKLANNTYLKKREGGNIAVLYHETDVVIYQPHGKTILESGGFRTKTTKERIIEFSPARVYQRQSVWYMGDGSAYYDGMEVYDTGVPVKPRLPERVEKEMKEKKKRVKKYIDGFCKYIKEGKLEAPSGGDCWGCLMFQDRDPHHIKLHMEEKYYVPSLLVNAIKEKGYNDSQFLFSMIHSYGQRGELYYATRRILRDYLMKRDV